jgi:transposase-like protein
MTDTTDKSDESLAFAQSVASPFDRPRWTQRDAREVLAALRRSGKPVSVFAAEHGLDPQRVYLWRRLSLRRNRSKKKNSLGEFPYRPPRCSERR